MAEYDGISQFHKAALRRLCDAKELSQTPSLDGASSDADWRHLRGAVYLAGYAAECVLKEYFISRTPGVVTLSAAVAERRTAGENIPNIQAADGHNLTLLLTVTGLEEELTKSQARQQDWGICLKWKSNWRYDPSPPSRDYATDFVAAVERVYHWVLARI